MKSDHDQPREIAQAQLTRAPPSAASRFVSSPSARSSLPFVARPEFTSMATQRLGHADHDVAARKAAANRRV